MISSAMPFPCPACRCSVNADLDSPVVRCSGCGARLRSRVVETGDDTRAYDLAVVGQPEVRARVEAPWSAGERRRLAAWLWWSTIATLGLIGVLYALARWGS
jgi:hypothetical protein